MSQISALATILSAKIQEYPSVTQSFGAFEGLVEWAVYRVVKQYVHFEVEIDTTLSKAKFTSLIDSALLFPELLMPGAKVWVKYDSNNHANIEFEKFEKEEETKQKFEDLPNVLMSFNMLNAQYVQLRINGERAKAVILKREKIITLNPADKMTPSIYKLLIGIVPNSGEPFTAETQVMDANAEKFVVGTHVTARFNPSDRNLVAIDVY